MNPPFLRPAAAADVEDAWRWYEARREGLGDEFLDVGWDASRAGSSTGSSRGKSSWWPAFTPSADLATSALGVDRRSGPRAVPGGCRSSGNQKHYRARRDSPVFAELHGLVVKTVGVADPIRRALTPKADAVAGQPKVFVIGRSVWTRLDDTQVQTPSREVRDGARGIAGWAIMGRKESSMRLVVTLERDETGMVVAECPAIPGCVSQGRTEDEAIENIREAIVACVEARAASGMPVTIAIREVEVAV